ncbi:MAG: hypothetical protein EOM91_17775 [Sphingobacteriia bacterium]|nr:hypothetical protein [Sphingobacteriia bacterium]NCC41325.1 hypothetical protein [Gammaproteobacteria bacterium]
MSPEQSQPQPSVDVQGDPRRCGQPGLLRHRLWPGGERYEGFQFGVGEVVLGDTLLLSADWE